MGVRRKHMFDHSNCGIGAIANLDGAYSHEIIEQGMDAGSYYKSQNIFITKNMELVGHLRS